MNPFSRRVLSMLSTPAALRPLLAFALGVARGSGEPPARIGVAVDRLLLSMSRDEFRRILGGLDPQQLALVEQIYDGAEARLRCGPSPQPAGVAS